MQRKTGSILLAFAVAAGCGTDDPSRVATEARTSLRRSQTCNDVLAALKADAASKLNQVIDTGLRIVATCLSRYSNNACAYGSGFPSSVAPQLPGGTYATGIPDPTTSLPVKGVDAPDIVGSDDTNVYVLHGRAFKVLRAQPASALAEVASIDLEGTPYAMFVGNGKAVIYSQVVSTPILAAAGVSPRPAYADSSLAALGYGNVSGGFPPPNPSGSFTATNLTKMTVLTLGGAIPTTSREMYFEGVYLDARRAGALIRTVIRGPSYGPALDFDFSTLFLDPSNPGTTDDDTGSDSSSPQTGTKMIAALEQLRTRNLAIIDASQLSDWLPHTFVKDSDTVTAHTVACEDVYVPTVGSTQAGITEIASVALDDPATTVKETAVFGDATTVYANADTLYLAANAWIAPPFVWNVVGETPGVTGNVYPGSSTTHTLDLHLQGNVHAQAGPSVGNAVGYLANRTHLHKFDLTSDPKMPRYVASGTVDGSLTPASSDLSSSASPYAIDVRDDALLLATVQTYPIYITDDGQVRPTVGTAAPPQWVNDVSALVQNGPWLEKAGDVAPFGGSLPLFGMRFAGRLGVLLLGTGSLSVVDFTNPRSPKLQAGPVVIPGFVEFARTIDETHLLTVATARNNSTVMGFDLAIVDVSNAASPVVTHQFALSGSPTSAFGHATYFADRNVLALPTFTTAGNDGSPLSATQTMLELFKVDLATGFTRLGGVDHSPLFATHPNGFCNGSLGIAVRRGLFLERFLYSVSYGGVIATNTDDLAAPGTIVALSPPRLNGGYDVCPDP